MNITETFRRKNKHHKPIIVFKELYRDYFKHNTPLNYSSSDQTKVDSSSQFGTLRNKNNTSKKQPMGVSSLQRTKSVEQFTQYLQKYGEPGCIFFKDTCGEQLSLKRSQTLKNSKLSSQLVGVASFQELQNSKRCYFKNSYTKNHQFFSKSQNLLKQKQNDQKQNEIPAILPQIFKQSAHSLKKPMQRRIQLQEIKQKFVERKQKAVQKFSKVRYNFLINKNYKPQPEDRILQTQRQSTKNSFQVTKSNIFPQSVF